MVLNKVQRGNSRDLNADLNYPSRLMNRAVLDKWCERGILALVLAILLFTPLAFGGCPQPPAGFALDFLLVDTFQVVQWLTVALVVLWAARLWLSPRPALLWPPICWAVLAFTVYAVARYLTADIEYPARLEFIRFLVYGFLFFVILNNLHRQESVQTIAISLIILAVGVSGYAFYQFATGSTRVWHVFTDYQHRASGTYICPNHLGGFLEMLVPVGLGYTLTGRVKPVTRIVLGYSTLVMLAGIAVTVSRGTWLSASMAVLFFFVALLFHRTFRLPAMVFLGLILVCGFLFLPRSYFFQARARNVVVNGKVYDDLRFLLWEPAIKVWKQNFWWGAGPGLFDYRFRQYRPEIVQHQPDRVHNDYLNVLADWGLTGAAIMAAGWCLLGISAVKTFQAIKSSADLSGRRTSNKFAFVVGGTLGLFAILIHSMVDFNINIPANALIAVA